MDSVVAVATVAGTIAAIIGVIIAWRQHRPPRHRPRPIGLPALSLLRRASTPVANSRPRATRRFTGRTQQLTELRARLNDERQVVLYGLGGVGKTQLAIAHITRHRREYDVVWWLRAEQPASLAQDFAGLARALSLPEQAESNQDIVVAGVRRWLEGHSRWLLVFDNAEHAPALDPFLPESPRGQVLITSRNDLWRDHAVIRVQPWARAESLEFLRRSLPPRAWRPDDAATLAADLGDLPLALEQASAYLEASLIPIRTYLERLRTRAGELFQTGSPAGDEHTIATVWSLSLDRIRETPGAAELLTVCAYLAPDDIPRSLLNSHANLLPEPISSVASDQFAYDRALMALRRYSLLTVTADTLAVHRLVQTVVRQAQGTEEPAWAAVAVRVVAAAFPPDGHEVQAWPACQGLLGHALVITERTQGLGVDPEATASLLNHAALYLYGRAEFNQARALLERALLIQEATVGPDHLDVATTLANLGRMLRSLGEHAQARDAHQRALAIRLRRLPPEDAAVGESLNEVGVTLRDLGELGQARTHHEQALAIREARHGLDHPDVAWTLNNLGNVLRDLGDLEGAKSAHERALAIREARLGPDHTEVARSLNNLGKVVHELGDLTTACVLLERALAIREARLGPDPPSHGPEPQRPRQRAPRPRRPRHRPHHAGTSTHHPRDPPGTRPPRHQTHTSQPCGNARSPEGRAVLELTGTVGKERRRCQASVDV